MKIKEAVFAWAKRMARLEELDIDRLDFVIQSDGHVYALPKDDHDRGAVAWWPLPYLGPEGEAARIGQRGPRGRCAEQMSPPCDGAGVGGRCA